MKGQCLVDLSLAGATYQQTVYVGRLEGLDLLLGMDFLATYGVELDCGARTVRIGADEISFGRALKVGSNDLVRMDKTVRIRSRGVQRVSCHLPDLSRVGQEVLVEGVANLGDLLFVMPSLEDSDDFDEGASEAITILSPELRWELLCEMWTRTREMSAVITVLSPELRWKPLGVGESSVEPSSV